MHFIYRVPKEGACPETSKYTIVYLYVTRWREHRTRMHSSKPTT